MLGRGAPRRGTIARHRARAVLALAVAVAASAALGAGVEEAEKAYKAGDYARAAKLAEPEAKAGDAAGLIVLGKAQMRLDQLDAALASFAKALEIAPKAEGAHYFRGTILAKMGKPGPAEKDLAAETEVSPGCGPCHMSLAVVRRELGKKSLAAQSLLRCLDIDGRDVAARKLLIKTYIELGKPNDAALHAGKLPKDDADRGALHYNVALVFYQKKQDAKAVAQLRAAMAIQPKHPRARYLLGLTLARQGKRDEARTELQAFLGDQADGPDADSARKVLAALD